MSEFAGKVALVTGTPEHRASEALLTGAIGSLGRAQGRLLARHGALLFLLDRPGAAGGEAFVAEIVNFCSLTLNGAHGMQSSSAFCSKADLRTMCWTTGSTAAPST